MGYLSHSWKSNQIQPKYTIYELKAGQSWHPVNGNNASPFNQLLQISASYTPSEILIMWQSTNKAIRKMVGKTGKKEKDLNTY